MSMKDSESCLFICLFGQSSLVHDRQFSVNLSPVPHRHSPFLSGFECCQVKRFKKRLAAGENAALPVQFAVSGVKTFDRICGIDHDPDI